jgi:hypothetical protein
VPSVAYDYRQTYTYGYTTTTVTPTSSVITNTPFATIFDVGSYRKLWNHTPGYHRKVKLGIKLPENGFVTSRYSNRPPRAVGVGLTRSGPSGVNYSLTQGSVVYGGSGLLVPDFSSAMSELNLKVLSKTKQSSFNAPIFLAQAGKTTDMVMDRLADLRQLVRSLKKGDISSFLERSKIIHARVVRSGRGDPRIVIPSTSKLRRMQANFNQQFGRDSSIAAGNVWLEAKYGWMSVMQDVYGLSKTLEEVRSKDVNLLSRTRASVTRKRKATLPHTFEQTPSCTGTISDTESILVRARYDFRINNPDLLLPAKVGLTNPLSVAWEVIPFSFVVDWFFPIGKYLDAADVPLLYTFSNGIASRRSIWYREYLVLKSERFNQSVTGTGSHLSTYKDRLQVAAPSLDFVGVTLKFGANSPSRVASSLALLAQSFVGFSHPSSR